MLINMVINNHHKNQADIVKMKNDSNQIKLHRMINISEQIEMGINLYKMNTGNTIKESGFLNTLVDIEILKRITK